MSDIIFLESQTPLPPKPIKITREFDGFVIETMAHPNCAKRILNMCFDFTTTVADRGLHSAREGAIHNLAQADRDGCALTFKVAPKI